MSRILSPSCGASAITGRNEDADWRMYFPARYSGVAPSGTADSKTCRPTLDHWPTGSRTTPRFMSAEARVRREVRRVLVRRTSGRGVSLASKKANASEGEKRERSFEARNGV